MDMRTYTIVAKKRMPTTPALASERVKLVLADLGVRPPGFGFNVHHHATGRHLERVVIALPPSCYAEAEDWFGKLCDALPWACRVTLVPEIGRIEITPQGQ
jgi:hypothetical protein